MVRIPPRQGGALFPSDAMPQSLACLHYHLIFSTKGREPLLVGDLPNRLYAYIGGILRNQHGALLAAGGMPDHVHLLVSLGRESSVSEIVREIKGSSSRWIHETIPGLRAFAWQAGYGAFTVSYSHIDRIKEYIANQGEHHRGTSFQDEYLAFLRRHDLAFDERYLWD